jgi:RND superfamily putative drug exporter
MFQAIAALVNRRGWMIVVGWLIFAAILWWWAPAWKDVSRDDDVRFFPKGFPTVLGQDLLERGFPDDVSSSTVVVAAERRPGRLTTTDFAYIDRMTNALAGLREAEPVLGIKRVTDHRTPVIGNRLISRGKNGDGQAALTIVSLKATYVSKRARETVDRLLETIKALPPAPAGLNIATTGSAAVGHDSNTAANDSIAATTNATIILVVVILLVVYRSPLLALIPLATIALSVWTSLMAIALLTKIPGLNFQVINITNVFVIVVLFGAGTDYCLFLIARYREELARGRPSDDALNEAISQVGGALIASAGTVIVGLGMLSFSTFAKIQYTGPAIALSLAIALIAALTLAPVLLHWLRGAVFWPFRPPHHEQGRDPEQESLEQSPASGFWAWVATKVVRYPGVILSVSVLALVPFAVLGLRSGSSYSQLADLNPDQPSVVGARIVERYFAVGELGPTTILINHPTLSFRSEQGRAAVEALCQNLAKLPEIAEVRSVSRPLGKPVDTKAEPPAAKGVLGNFLSFDRLARETKRALLAATDPRYVSIAPANPNDRDRITRIDVIFLSDPFSGESLATLRRVKAMVEESSTAEGPLAGVPIVGYAGTTAMVSDLARVTSMDERRMYLLVTAGVYFILLWLLRRPGICLYLIATVVLGYLASLGLTDMVFRAIHSGPEPWAGLDWKVGFFLFVILVAVGEDYNIFLMSRVIEEERRHGPAEGTRLAIAHTGGIISSCGLIMAGTFGAMITGSLTALRELGFALGLGVILDTFVVRPILVPAFIVLLHRVKHHLVGPRRESASEPFEDSEQEPTPACATESVGRPVSMLSKLARGLRAIGLVAR